MIRVIERAGQVLGAFTPERRTLTLTECAHAVELNISSTYRLLLSLEAIGLVERDGNDWGLGARVVTLANVRAGQVNLRRLAADRMPQLCQELRVGGAVSIPDGDEMIYLDRYEGPDPIDASPRVGSRIKMWLGASGQGVLSRMSPAVRAELLRGPAWADLGDELQRRTRAAIELGSERGFVVDPGLYSGIAGVAVPISDAIGRPVAAVSLTMAPTRLDDELAVRLGQRLRREARAFEEALGGMPAESDAGAGR